MIDILQKKIEEIYQWAKDHAEEGRANMTSAVDAGLPKLNPLMFAYMTLSQEFLENIINMPAKTIEDKVRALGAYEMLRPVVAECIQLVAGEIDDVKTEAHAVSRPRSYH